ncbi:MAG: ChaN family lipoprotein [Phycisphaerales bacterium]|nr:ChaN family lipoprotein [Phycisphaerales bacterium]
MRHHPVSAAIASFLAGAVAVGVAASDPAWAPPPIERSVAVFDGRTGAPTTFDAMLDALADADAVFLGETHVDETTHRVELAVYDGLLQRRRGRVVLAMEMFDRDVQPALDAYVAGTIDEATFLARARPWAQYRSAYRPLIERARRDGLPVVGSNIPRALTRRIAMEGLGVLDTLTPEQRRAAPAELHPNTPAYWRRVDNAIRGHVGMMGGGGDDRRLTSTQTLWDNTMGESCASALDAHPGAAVLHVNGGFHSAYWDGTVRQFQIRRPDARVLTVDINPTRNPSVVEVDGTPVADFVVMAESRATDLNEGAYTVALDRTLDYQLHVPPTASDATPVPLLIWLGDDGLTARDGLDLWRDRLGDDVAVAVLEPPYRALLDDLSEGGRWFWPDSFAGDLGALVASTERAWAYLARHMPIDPARVCIAGEGTGATVVAAIALLGDRMDARAVAFEPRRYAGIKDFPLPLPEYRSDDARPDVTLTVVGADADEAWWREELDAYAAVGLPGAIERATDDASQRDRDQERRVREALGLDPAPVAAGEATPAVFVVDADSPRARHWARLYGLRHAAATGQPVAVLADAPTTEDGRAVLAASIHPDTVGEALPRCPGPFGGTTVLVLAPDAPEADVRAWLALEQNDPLNRTSRFHRVRIARTDAAAGDRALPRLLDELESSGRKNVLIVPAAFCADAATMRGLERLTRAAADRMTIRWLPGLGGGDLPVATTPAAAPIGVVGHDLHVTLDPATHHLAVTDVIALPPALRRAGASFTLNPALTITSSTPAVRRSGESDGDDVRYELASTPPGGVLSLVYDGVVDYGLGDQQEEYSRGMRDTRGVIGPEGVYLDGGTSWVARFGDEMLRFTVEVEAPADWHVISQGNGASDAAPGRARWDSAADLEQVYLVGGPLVVERETAGAVEVLVYLHAPDEALSRKYLDATARYIEMYRQLIGPYPYGKFALVENFWETGYGMPSFTLLGEQVIRLPFILHSSYPHEILHNWWGNSVFVDYASGNWCEGLTAYMADHLIQEQRGGGAEYRRNSLQKYRNYVKEGRDFPLAEFRNRHSAATEAVGYGKALMMFHMLRRHVGDDAFRRSMVDFYRTRRGTRASFDDIRASIQSVTGEDLRDFFTQWVRRPGAPSLRLTIDGVEAAADGAATFTVRGSIEQTHDDAPFTLSVPVVVETSSGPTAFTVEMTGRTQPFECTVDGRPAVVAVDPMFDVFRQLDPRETPCSIGQIFGEPSILAVLPSGAPNLDAYRDLMTAWTTGDHAIEMVLDTDLDALPADRAAWILGRTNRFADAILAFDPDAHVTARGSHVTLGDDAVPVDDRTVVVIRRHPDQVERAIGWISVEPDDAFAGLARKLPHYGKYSYVAFEGDEPTNIAKGQWDVSDSPLVARLDPHAPATVSADPRVALAELPPVFSRRTLHEHVAWLAAPERRGRGLGTPELDASAQYIADQFAAIGLEPGGDDGSWFQTFTVPVGPDGRPTTARNVVGALRGKEPGWATQSVVLGAHYDHLGAGWPDVHAGDEGRIHPGADDNASGVAVMIELARTLAAEGAGRRTIVFVAFSAEECGLHGSRFYVAHPTLPAADLRAMVNLDTVGRLGDGEISIHATGTADEWPHIFRGVGFVTGIRSRSIAARVGGSDQESFIDAGIPAVQIFTGAHADYHRPTDTIDLVDDAGLVTVASFVKEAIVYLLDREEPLTVRIDGVATARAPAGEGGRRVSFGTVPDFDYRGEGVRVDSVVPDSPAARAGVRAGDVIIRIDDTALADLRAFSEMLRTLAPGQSVRAALRRDGAEVVVPVVVEAR